MGRHAGKAKRKIVRNKALEAVAGLSDEELKNLSFELGREMGAQARHMNELRIRLDAVKVERQRRATSTPSGIHITDHAVVRYLERVKGMDVDAVRAEIGEMAQRARRQKDGQHGRRRDDSSGLVFGVDEETTHVTTVFAEDELVVMEVA